MLVLIIASVFSSTQTDPIRCFNAETKQNCAVILCVPGLPADNPQQSEEASHIGGNANCICWKCNVGGNHKWTESNSGYYTLHLVSIILYISADCHLPLCRVVFYGQTWTSLERQLDLACHGVARPIATEQTLTGVKDKIAQHWIDILPQKSREMKHNQPGRTAESIANELREWLKDQPGDKMNPLLSIEGVSYQRS